MQVLAGRLEQWGAGELTTILMLLRKAESLLQLASLLQQAGRTAPAEPSVLCPDAQSVSGVRAHRRCHYISSGSAGEQVRGT